MSICVTSGTRLHGSNPYVSGGREAFLADTMIQDAVIRNLEVIGEAVKNLSSELRVQHPDVPWTRIAGMRDVLIHEYFGVRVETVWAQSRIDFRSSSGTSRSCLAKKASEFLAC